MRRILLNFIKFKDLLIELVKRDIKVKYKNSVLGILWSMLNPLLMMIVLSIVFSSLFKRDIENFPVYVLTGRIIYSFFSESTKFAMNSIVVNGKLIRKIYIPKYFFPLAKVLSTFITFVLSMIPLVIVMIITGVRIKIIAVLGVFPLMYLLISVVGIGMILATVNVFFRDVAHFYSIVLMVVMYMTPIFYPISIIPDRFLFLIKLNPLFYITHIFREYVIYGNMVPIQQHIVSFGAAIGYLIIGIILFYRSQDKFVHHI